MWRGLAEQTGVQGLCSRFMASPRVWGAEEHVLDSPLKHRLKPGGWSEGQRCPVRVWQAEGEPSFPCTNVGALE